jgi:hypothetical protein
MADNFNKPRAHINKKNHGIKIEVQRDERIANHL